MSMLPDGIIPIGEGHGRVFDFVWTTGHSLITDYHRLDRDVWASNSIEVSLGSEKERISITSIEKLISILKEFVSVSMEILQRHTPSITSIPQTRPDSSELKSNLLIEQLVFDILFDKYLNESEPMTRNGYSTYMAHKLYPDAKEDYRHAINERLTRGMKVFHDKIECSELRAQIEILGADPDKYVQYYIPRIGKNSSKKKPKFIWDQLYYNFGLELSYRQYRRQLTRDNHNYSYEEIVNDLKSYNNFATMLLPAEYESYEKYFRMSMDYYVLEVYKRVDFIFKLIDALDPDEIATIDKNHFLVSRFVPCVLVPFIQDGELHFNWKHKYYRPMFIVEDMLLKAASEDSEPSYKYYESLLKKYQYVRAKAYELFKYHCVFHSTNYVEIKKFLCECYDMRSYHQSNTFWNLLQDNEWAKMGKNTQNLVRKQIEYFLSINDAFFWKSPNRDFVIPKNE